MDPKVAIVTGASNGVGLETARGLCAKGWHVVMACRSKSAAEKAMQDIRSSRPSGTVEFLPLELTSFDSVRAFSRHFHEKQLPLHALVNNAGLNSGSVPPGEGRTGDGFDFMFKVNYLSHFLLTQLLLGTLKASAPSRVVNLSSVTHRFGNPDFARHHPLPSSRDSVKGSYSDSKLAMCLICYELARQLEGTGVTVTAVNPGAVNSQIWRNSFTSLPGLKSWVFPALFLTPEQACRGSVEAASAEALGDGRPRYLTPYWHPYGGSLATAAPLRGSWLPSLHFAFDFVGYYNVAHESLPDPKGRDLPNAKALFDLSKGWVGL